MPHHQPSERFRIHRWHSLSFGGLPFATTLTNIFLGAFSTTNQTQAIILTEHFLGTFGLTGNPQGRVQGLSAKPAND
ncbi:MAG: hypothetical protein WCA07_01405 [Gloeobacterales cyanobacterium]